MQGARSISRAVRLLCFSAKLSSGLRPRCGLVPFPGLGVAQRHGTLGRGERLGNFSWLRREGLFAAMPGGPMLDLSFDRVAPRHVLTGFSGWEWELQVHAGVVVGWVHKPAALVGERLFGRGAFVATTFRLTLDPPGRDPVAATLMRCLIDKAAGHREASAP